jgi:glycosyltransferase involved in cell wall biosynthesis
MYASQYCKGNFVKLLFFIPSFNDQQGLLNLVQSLVESYQEATVLVVDDGSSPPLTLSPITLMAENRVLLHRIAFNVGLGLVTSVALDCFLDGDFDFLIRLDADGQHPLNEIEGLLFPLIDGKADVVWGERTNHMMFGSPKRVMGALTKQATAWMGQVIFSSQVKDWFTGFFAINQVAAKRASEAHLERYCEVQLLCIFHSTNLRVKTHRVEQLDRQFGDSHITWFDGVQLFLRSTLMMLLYALRMHPK